MIEYIPKKIHYCWLSNEKMPNKIQMCISTWKKILYEYDFKLWNTENFDIDSVPFVKQAFNAKKWAYAADYIRLFAVYFEGGIYLDTDVIVLKNFNNFLKYDFFSSLERDLTTIPLDSFYYDLIIQNKVKFYSNEILRHEGLGLQAAIFGAKAGNFFIRDCMKWYEKNNFLIEGNQYFSNTGITAPDIYASIARNYGFKYIPGIQLLKNNMIILPADYFPNHYFKTENAYAIHLCENSWAKSNKLFSILFTKLKQNNLIRTLFNKKRINDYEDLINEIVK